jgi:pyruvate/2-oxoglutarate dehydrogenase complex dihydrolipoamide acyltransferase (E2) component
VSSDTKEYRYVDTVPGELLDGQPIAPGEYAHLTDEDVAEGHLKEMLETGRLISVQERVQPQATDAASKAANKAGILLSEITPTGKDGSITVEDVQRTEAERKEQEEAQ